MRTLVNIFFLAVFAHSSLAEASPAETNHFQITFSGADAEAFKAEQVIKTSKEYGAQGSHIMYDFNVGFVKVLGDGASFNFLLECQQRVLNYRTENSQSQQPACTFSYFTKVTGTSSKQDEVFAYTSIDVVPEFSQMMIQNFGWTEFGDKGAFYFGCQDNKETGCPNIRYYPASGNQEAEVEISYYKP